MFNANCYSFNLKNKYSCYNLHLILLYNYNIILTLK